MLYNCFYSAARVRRSHRQGRAGCYPVMLMGTTSQQDVAPCTVTVGCFRRLALCYLHVRTVVVFTFCLSASCSCDHHVFSQQFCLFACFFPLLFLASFMLSSCLRGRFSFSFCVLMFHVVSAMASTLMSPRQFTLCDHCCVFMWGKKWVKLLFHGIAQVELCRDSALIPFSSGYARS